MSPYALVAYSLTRAVNITVTPRLHARHIRGLHSRSECCKEDLCRSVFDSFWALTGICLDDICLGAVWHIGEVEPGRVGRGAGITVPLRIERILAADDAIGALAPEIPSKSTDNPTSESRGQSDFRV